MSRLPDSEPSDSTRSPSPAPRPEGISKGKGKQLEIQVQVVPNDGGGVTFLYDGEPQLIIETSTRVELDLLFELDLDSGRFVTFPVNWFSTPLLRKSAQPVGPPTGLRVLRESERRVRILDESSAPGTYNFTFSVLRRGVVCTSTDPTIINRPDPPDPIRADT